MATREVVETSFCGLAVCSLTQGPLGWAAGGRADLAPVVLDALGHLDEGRVSGEAALGGAG